MNRQPAAAPYVASRRRCAGAFGKKMKVVIERFRKIGKHPICSGHPSRAPKICGWCFPLCYRCTAFILAFTICSLTKVNSSAILTTLMILPMAIDSCLQYFMKFESTTCRRILTGALAGVGVALL